MCLLLAVDGMMLGAKNIKKDEQKEGYILFNGVEYGYTKGSLEFQVRVNDGSGDVIDTIRFDFKK